MKSAFILVVVSLASLSLLASTSGEFNLPDVVVQKPSIKCRMYKTCSIDMLFKKTLDINQLAFRSNNPKIIEFLSMEPCKESNLTKPCLLFSDFNVSSQIIDEASYIVRRVFVDAKLIGNASLQVFQNDRSSFPLVSVNVFLSAPRRVVDILFGSLYLHSSCYIVK